METLNGLACWSYVGGVTISQRRQKEKKRERRERSSGPPGGVRERISQRDFRGGERPVVPRGGIPQKKMTTGISEGGPATSSEVGGVPGSLFSKGSWRAGKDPGRKKICEN